MKTLFRCICYLLLVGFAAAVAFALAAVLTQILP